MNRRKFLSRSIQSAASALLLPSIVPSSVLGRTAIPPSGKTVLGCIGLGGQGIGNMQNFLQFNDVRIAAVCDVDAKHLREASEIVNGHYGNRDCAAYRDFRELLARDDIDAVSVATPDHWHGIVGVLAAESGRDIYGEKPLTHNLAEGRALCDAVRRQGRVWQTGSWQRSVDNFRFACELVRNGRIGRIHRVEVGLPEGYSIQRQGADMYRLQNPPAELDYDFWLGPAPESPYFPARTHWNWRWNLDYGGGQLLDWVGHHVDIAHWALGLDRTGPVEIEGKGEYPADGPFNTAVRYRIETRYRDGLDMVIAGGHPDVRFGTKWIGESGWVWVTRGDTDAGPKSLLKERFGPGDVRLYHSDNHHRNFIDCVRSRAETITPCETAHRSATPGHLGQIAMRLGRKIRFNPDTEEILNDPDASRMLSRPMRGPWGIGG
jgi:predicted dehydrogenase